MSRIASETPGIQVHIHPENLNPGAGDPVQLVRRAVQRIREIEKRRESFEFKAILLDVSDPIICIQAEVLARENGIDHLIWQEPDHEAFLLRHLPGFQQHKPPRGQSMNALRREWPAYSKGMPAIQLQKKIGLVEILAASQVEPQLRTLLVRIGFVNP